MTRRGLAFALVLWVLSPSGIASAQNSCESTFCVNVRRMVGHAATGWESVRQWDESAKKWQPTFDLIDVDARNPGCSFVEEWGPSTGIESASYMCLANGGPRLDRDGGRRLWNRLAGDLRAALTPQDGWRAEVGEDPREGLRLTLSHVDAATVKLVLNPTPSGYRVYLEIAPPARTGPPASTEPPRSAESSFVLANRCYEMAEKYYKEKAYDEAFKEYDEVIRLAMGNSHEGVMGYREQMADAYYKRGWIHNERGRYQRAIADLSESIRIHPRSAAGFIELGFAYSQISENRVGELEAAVQNYSAAIGLDPKSYSGFSGRAAAYRRLGQFARAVVDASQALTLRPDDLRSLLIRAASHFNLRDLASALRDYSAAVSVSPKDAEALYGRGVTKRVMGNVISGDADIAVARLWRADIAQVMAAKGVKPPN